MRLNQDFKCLHDCVLALGASLVGENQRCLQFLQLAWASFVVGMFDSQSVHVVQATHLLVFPK